MCASPEIPGAGEPHPGTFAMRLAELNEGEVEQFVVDTLATVARAQQASLAVYDEREDTLEIRATRGYAAELVSSVPMKPGDCLMGEVLASGTPRIVPNIADAFATAGHVRHRYRTRSCLLVPVTAAGRRLAVLSLADRIDGKPFDAGDLERLRTFFGPVTLALLASRLSADKVDLARLVDTDPLTGLSNRRSFGARLHEEVERALRYKSNLTLLAVDIDLFKSVNDRFGHAVGDAVLQGVATAIKGAVRFFDICARLGGDEFMILLHGNEAIARQTAERLLHRISEWRLDPVLGFPPDVRITISIGIAALSTDSSDVQTLLARADHALYAAKAEGRNRVTVDE